MGDLTFYNHSIDTLCAIRVRGESVLIPKGVLCPKYIVREKNAEHQRREQVEIGSATIVLDPVAVENGVELCTAKPKPCIPRPNPYSKYCGL